MNESVPEKTEPAMLERFAADMAARRFHDHIDNLTSYQKYEILTDYVRKVMGEAWKKAPDTVPGHYFLSFEYAFGKPTRFSEQAFSLKEDLRQLAEILGSDYETLLQEEETPNLGYGTPGRFAAGWMEATTGCSQPYRGYGLRYRSGFIAQHIVRNRTVEAAMHERDHDLYPWEIRTERRYTVRFNGETFVAEGIDFPIPGPGGSPIHYVRLWDVMEKREIDTAEFKAGEYVKAYHQTFEPRRLVEFLYPSESNEPGKKLRLMQEYFFASATIQDILRSCMPEEKNGLRPFTIYLNEIHPSFAIPEMIRVLMDQYDYGFDESARFASQVFYYGNQILTDEAFECWPLELLEETVPVLVPVLKQMADYAKENSPAYAIQAEENQGIFRDNKLDLSNLCLYFCREVFTFSPSHKENLAARLGLNVEAANRLISVDAPDLAYARTLQRVSPAVYDCLLGDHCSKDKLARAKREKKQKFTEFLEKYQSRRINPHSIFSIHIGNFHENNRQLIILLYIAGLHRRLLESPHLDIPDTTFFFSGLAYPGYLMATETVHLINAYGKWLNRDTLIENKLNIVFLEEINPEAERELLSVADIYQAIRLPKHAALPMYVPEAILHGAAVFASGHGYTKQLAQQFPEEHCAVTVFEEGNTKEEAAENLRFLVRQQRELEFDASTIQSILERYNDSFSVLRSYASYEKQMNRLTQLYMDEDTWNRDRAMSQRRMFEIIQNNGGLPCAGL